MEAGFFSAFITVASPLPKTECGAYRKYLITLYCMSETMTATGHKRGSAIVFLPEVDPIGFWGLNTCQQKPNTYTGCAGSKLHTS